jgi:hypothetical protein
VGCQIQAHSVFLARNRLNPSLKRLPNHNSPKNRTKLKQSHQLVRFLTHPSQKMKLQKQRLYQLLEVEDCSEPKKQRPKPQKCHLVCLVTIKQHLHQQEDFSGQKLMRVNPMNHPQNQVFCLEILLFLTLKFPKTTKNKLAQSIKPQYRQDRIRRAARIYWQLFPNQISLMDQLLIMKLGKISKSEPIEPSVSIKILAKQIKFLSTLPLKANHLKVVVCLPAINQQLQSVRKNRQKKEDSGSA